ncbi:MAG: hypothetical protein LBC92_00975, partial [Rickettsiales bacterium]|nr:hypothetical protein [Rickettsiales bacterium]
MNIYYRHLKKEFFDKYKKYWYSFAGVVIFYIIYSLFSYSLNVDNITLNIKDAIYVGNAVAINPKQLIINKSLADESCWDRNHFAQGNFYAINEYNIFQLTLEERDEMTNMLLLRVKGSENHLKDFAILDMEEPNYKINDKLFAPIQKNKVSVFNYKSAKIVGVDKLEFYVVIRNVLNSDYIVGTPLFNKNFLLQGVVKNKEDPQKIENRMDRMIAKANAQKYFSVNRISSIRRFLDKRNVEYYVA